LPYTPDILAALGASRAYYEQRRDLFVAALKVPTITGEQAAAGQALAGVTDSLIDYVTALLLAQHHELDEARRERESLRTELASLRAMLDPGDLPFDGDAL
jgi:hypothetical protein